MKIKGFEKGKGDYFIGRYVDYWKSGDYFHKKKFILRDAKETMIIIVSLQLQGMVCVQAIYII